MSIDIYKSILNNLDENLEIGKHDVLSEDEVMVILVKRVEEMLENDKDLLMSYLYRLDIPQKQIMSILRVTNIIPPAEGLARLILNRQIQRMNTKIKYKQDPIEGWEF